ncbi:hypothetical protein [Paenibacillus cymbidii]|uniref:hypothetical protein n=1 Tax=Paenibacillus cymbidii TaxID=1639034 RepID=UPI00108228C1|nr:hypothetical protein [Paenibacillus cymbidii]
MKHIVLIFLFISMLCVTGGCKNADPSLSVVGDALGHAEKTMRDKGFITASSFQPEEYAKFRIMAGNHTSKEEAKELVENFLRAFESRLEDIEKFYQTHEIIFDIKSDQDGEILFSGKKDHDQKIWWQF